MGIQNNNINQYSNTEIHYAKYLQKEGLLPYLIYVHAIQKIF